LYGFSRQQHSSFSFQTTSILVDVLTTPSHRESLGLASTFLQHPRIFSSIHRDPKRETFPKLRRERHRALARRISSKAAGLGCGPAYRQRIQTHRRDNNSGTSTFCDQTLAFSEFLPPALTIRPGDR